MPVIGTQQSPIRIVTRKTLLTTFPPDYLEFEHVDKAQPGTFKNENFVWTKPLPGVTFRGEKWLLHKVHIHRPAEHLIDTTAAASFECHLIHMRQKDPCERGEKLVIGVFFDIVGTTAPLSSFSQIDEALAAKLGQVDDELTSGRVTWEPEDVGVPLKINPVHFLPSDRREWDKWFHYEGSLTSGIYSEDVSWIVLPKHAQVKATEVKVLAKHAAEQHARDVCAVDRRFVLRNFGPATMPEQE